MSPSQRNELLDERIVAKETLRATRAAPNKRRPTL
jgi:hypothetical protein